LLKNYGITVEAYEAKRQAQDGKCACCGIDESDAPRGRLYVDHDHDTGQVRDLLCSNCNMMIGYALEDTRILRAGAAYVAKWL